MISLCIIYIYIYYYTIYINIPIFPLALLHSLVVMTKRITTGRTELQIMGAMNCHIGNGQLLKAIIIG